MRQRHSVVRPEVGLYQVMKANMQLAKPDPVVLVKLAIVSAIAIAMMSVAMRGAAHAANVLEVIKNKFEKVPNPVLESGYWMIDRTPFGVISWLDNNRILFVGGALKTWNARVPNVSALYIWDTQSNNITKYADAVGMCYHRGYVFYTTKVTKEEFFYREGKFGEEKEFRQSTKDREKDGERLKQQGSEFRHPLTCSTYNPKELAGVNWEKNQLTQIFPLLKGHGYLDLFGWNPLDNKYPVDTDPVRWFPPVGGNPINLPMPKRAINRSGINYAEWNSSYLLYGDKAPPNFDNVSGTWPDGVPQPIWLLHAPDGEIHRQELPYVKWLRGAYAVFSSRAGFIVLRGDGTADMGLYLLVGKIYQKLIFGGGGVVNNIGISPDGCKVAGAVTMQFNNRDGGLKMVNVCEKQEK